MRSHWGLLTALNVAFLLAAFGCGDEGGGCGPEPAKKEEQSSPSGVSGNTGSGSRGADIQISDKKGRVPKAYQRPASAYEPAKSTTTVSRILNAVSSATAAGYKIPKLGVSRVTKRGLDGVPDRVEISCRILALSASGECSSAANYAQIKKQCCPNGVVERCAVNMSGVILVGRGCEPDKR